jgi:hypothetical protein
MSAMAASVGPPGTVGAVLGKHRQVVRASLRERLATLDRGRISADDRRRWTASKTS